MRERINSFIVVLLFMFQAEISAQEKSLAKQSVTTTVYENNGYFFGTFGPGKYYSHKILYTGPKQLKSYGGIDVGGQKNPGQVNLFRPEFYKHQPGFFCRQELQLEKITAIPFRFRLGSLEYVNYLEQKPNSVNPNR